MGTWKFNWVRKPADRPVNFYKTNYDISNWKDIKVPGHWELQGYGVPIYTDVSYPFPNNEPFIPHDYNPVGSYKRTLLSQRTGMVKKYISNLVAFAQLCIYG